MKIFQTDWLASETVFYNTENFKISNNVNDVINWDNVQIDYQALYNYLTYGYCVFGRTIVKNVLFLEANTQIKLSKEGLKLKIVEDDWEMFGNYIKPEKVLDEISKKLNDDLKGYKGNIVIPTSGGYDSRLLNYLCKKKKQIFSCSYGNSKNQKNSSEVQIAKNLSKKLNTKHEFIELKNYHKYDTQCYKMYGCLTHLNANYHIEFFNNLLIKFPYLKNSICISGIYGDLWSGKHLFEKISHPDNLYKLGITHNVSIEDKYIKLKRQIDYRDEYFENNKKLLENVKYYPVLAARQKMVLINFLLKVPQSLGFDVKSPFLSKKIVNLMLNLDTKQRENRKWQVDFFKKNELIFTKKELKCDVLNVLELDTIKKYQPENLNISILGHFIDKKFLAYINNVLINISYPREPITVFDKIYNKLSTRRHRMISKAINCYLILKPLEFFLKKLKI